MEHLLPFGRAVHGGGFILIGVDAGDGRKVQNRGVAHILPEVCKRQDERPWAGGRIPGGAGVSRGFLHGWNHTVLGIQEGIEEVADHDPAQEVREEHHGLVSFLEELSGDLVHHDGEGHRDDDAQNDEHDVVGQRVADHDPGGVGLEQELEVLESHPLTAQQVADKGGIAGIDLVIFERQHDTAHRQVAQQQQPDRHGSNHGQKYQGFLVLLKPARGLDSWLQTFGGFCSHSLFTRLSYSCRSDSRFIYVSFIYILQA